MNAGIIKKSLSIGSDQVEYICGNGAIDEENYEGIFIVSDVIMKLYPDKIGKLPEEKTILVGDGEQSKLIDNYEKVCRMLIERNVERGSYITYIGGGTVGDLVGFIASTYKRGMRLRAVPTTLLSQIDSSIGGKNGINFSGVKNAIGTFKNPERIIADTGFLMKNGQVLKDGMAEMIKHGFALDYAIIETLKENNIETIRNGNTLRDLILRNAEAKASVCNEDPFELGGKRYVLNFGHTVAHGVEAASRNWISHGSAVIYGMIFEMKIAELYGVAKYDGRKDMEEIMMKYGIEMPDVNETMLSESLQYIMNDKKIRGGAIGLPMAAEPGKVTVINMKLDVFRDLFLKAGRMM